jgi:hypothetical protein
LPLLVLRSATNMLADWIELCGLFNAQRVEYLLVELERI